LHTGQALSLQLFAAAQSMTMKRVIGFPKYESNVIHFFYFKDLPPFIHGNGVVRNAGTVHCQDNMQVKAGVKSVNQYGGAYHQGDVYVNFKTANAEGEESNLVSFVSSDDILLRIIIIVINN
jgi:hypothetical protein